MERKLDIISICLVVCIFAYAVFQIIRVWSDFLKN